MGTAIQYFKKTLLEHAKIYKSASYFLSIN